jgi:hypothetical protein
MRSDAEGFEESALAVRRPADFDAYKIGGYE